MLDKHRADFRNSLPRYPGSANKFYGVHFFTRGTKTIDGQPDCHGQRTLIYRRMLEKMAPVVPKGLKDPADEGDVSGHQKFVLAHCTSPVVRLTTAEQERRNGNQGPASGYDSRSRFVVAKLPTR